MQAHISVITLAVEDLQRALDFYRDGLGLATEGIIGQEFGKRPLNTPYEFIL